jgi:hypothetical protein
VPSSLGRQKYTGRLGGEGVEVVVGMSDGFTRCGLIALMDTMCGVSDLRTGDCLVGYNIVS